MVSLHSHSPEDTARFAGYLANAAHDGQLIALNGPLGAGKTYFVRAFAATLGVPEQDVASPTYLLIREYAGRLPIFHLDAYRLGDSDELLALGFHEICESEGVCLIEWASRIADVLPGDYLDITFEPTGPSSRTIHLTSHGPRSQALEATIADQIPTDGVR